MRNDSLRDQELELLEAAAADEWSSQFEVLMTTFDLCPEYREELSAALQTVEWLKSDQPLKTIHRAVLGAVFSTKAKKTKKGASVGLSTAEIGALAYHSNTLEAIRGRNGVCAKEAAVIPRGPTLQGPITKTSWSSSLDLKP